MSGTFTMTSERGDLQGQGRSYSFGASELKLGVAGDNIRVYQPRGEGWDVRFAAPRGKRLRPGVYANARRFSDSAHPGLSVGGAGRVCNTSTGQFTIVDIGYGPYGYVQSLRARFEYHCDGREPALRGQLNLTAAQAPPAVSLDLRFSPGRTRFHPSTGTIEPQGTVACLAGRPAGVGISAEVVEKPAGGAIGAGYRGFNTCSDRRKSWTVTVAGAGGRPFAGRDIKVELRAQAPDDPYTKYGGSGTVYAVDEVSSEVSIDLTPPPPQPAPLTIEVAYDAGRVVQNDDGGFVAELSGTVRCSRPVSATVSVLVMVGSGYQVPGGIDGLKCAPTPGPWLITTAISDELYTAEAPLAATIEGQAKASHTDVSGAYPVLASDKVEAEVDPLSPGDTGPDFGLLALLVVSVAALGSWVAFVRRWARGRRGARST